MKIIFMGTPDFAMPSLNELIDSENEVVAVFTQAPKPKGRGMKLTKSPIHNLAEDNGIKVYTPKTLRSEEVADIINSTEADIIVVVAYGMIVPKNILVAKKYGCLNIHPSKLPRHRGAAPLQRTVMEGDAETEVCIMQMDEGLDTGPVLLRESFGIKEDITLSELHDVCAKKGAKLLLDVLDNIDTLEAQVQSDQGVTYAHKLSKEEGKIDWHEDAVTIERKFRAMNPWPGVYFEHEGQSIKIVKAKAVSCEEVDIQPGEIIRDQMMIKCKSGAFEIDEIKRPGKPATQFAEFIRMIGYAQK